MSEVIPEGGTNKSDLTTYRLTLRVSVLQFLGWLDNWAKRNPLERALPFIERVDDGFTVWDNLDLRREGAILPVHVKKENRWLEYNIEITCHELEDQTEIDFYYSPDIESFTMRLLIAAENSFRIPTGAAISETSVVPEQPKEPDAGAELDQWFDYYHAMKKAKKKFTLGDIASKVGLSEQNVKYKHSKYLNEHGN